MPDTYVDTGSDADYASKMPEFSNSADIKKAFQAYHYGDPALATGSVFSSEWTNPDVGIVGKLLYLNDADAALDAAKIGKSIFTAKGGIIGSTAANTPSELAVGANNFVLRANSATATGLEWYNPSTTHVSLDPSSQTIVGNILITKANPSFTINASAAAQTGSVVFRTNASDRWKISKDNTAEGGADAGSDFVVNRYSDAGALLGAAVTITRSTGLTTLSSLSVSGTMTGDLTGNSSTATALQTARTINGVSFDGTGNVVVPAAAGTLTGTTLNATVVSSSLTSVGTIGTGVWQGSVISSTYIDAAIARLASPALTGTPTGPTAAVDTNTTQLATTAYVVGQGYLKSATAASTYAPIDSPTFTGKITAAASTAPGGAGLRLPLGVDPTTPAHGDIWTTSTDVRAYVNGVTVVLAQAAGGEPVISASDINDGVLSPEFGGTGVNNGVKTITLSGNTTIGSSTHTVAFTTSGNTSVALPTSGTLATLASPIFTGTVTTPVLIGTDTTDSSSSTTGAFKTAGGMGVAKKLYVGTDLHVTNAIQMSTVFADRLVFYGTPGASDAFAFGVESGSTYAKAPTSHRWYINSNADGGVSSKMELVNNLLTVKTSLTVTTGTVTLPATTDIGSVSGTEIGYLDGVTSSIQTQINTKAPLASPTFTGTVGLSSTTSLAAVGDTATAATHYYVETASDGYIRPKTLANVKAEVVTTASVNAVSATTLGTVTSGTWQATTISSAYIDAAIARLASPTFTGTPAAPTAAVDTNTTQLATTAYVVGQGYLKSATAASTYAPLASPTFTGTVVLPTATSIGSASATEIGYLDGVTSSIQTQIDSKAPLASPALTGTATAVDLTVSGVLRDTVTANSQADSYTLVLADRGKMVECTKATANTVTVPPNSSVAYPVGSSIDILQVGTGQVTVAPGSGVTINGTPGLKLRTQWSSATLIKRATDTWVLIGDISA